MVTRRTRALLAVPLAFVLLPLVSLLVASATAAKPHAAMSWTQVHAKGPTTLQGVRTGPLDTSQHYPAPTPYVAARPFELWSSSPAGDVAASIERPSHNVAFARQHLARAPPEICRTRDSSRDQFERHDRTD